VLVAGLLAAAVAAPSIRNEFVADDRWVIAERPFLRQPPSIVAVLAEPYWPVTFGGSMWRPAVIASYALDYRVSQSPHWFHAINMIWAAASAALLALLACELGGPVVGLIAGALFAVHPVHVEAVANIVGRAELMAASGYAAALVCALRAAQRPVYLIGVAGGAAFAIASKELAATLPAAIALVYLARRMDVRQAWRPAVAAAVPIVLYYVVHAWVNVHGVSFAGGIAVGLEGLGIVQRTSAMMSISLEWWRLLLFPAHLSADYSPGELLVSTALTGRHFLGALMWVAAGLVAWRTRRTIPGVAIGLAWFVITMSPMANIVVPMEFLVAERTLYLPSFGIVFALASAVVAAPWSPRVRAGLVAGVVVLGATRSIARIPGWHDDELHYEALKRDAPRSYRTLWLEGKDEFAAARWGSGERLLQAAIAFAPGIAGPRLDLARFYFNARLWQPAVRQLVAATAVDSALAPAWSLLPRALLAAGDTAGAVHAAREGMRRFPGEADVQQSASTVLAAARGP
jgi:protein O-mannosyl-transferase